MRLSIEAEAESRNVGTAALR